MGDSNWEKIEGPDRRLKLNVMSVTFLGARIPLGRFALTEL
jgi:hypothetical protein